MSPEQISSLTGNGVFDAGTIVDEAQLGAFQLLVCGLCALVVFFDGFDTQVIAFIAPAISSDFHLSRADLGPLFVASLVGILIGALFFGPLADRFGRRRVILVCTALFALLSMASAASNGFWELLVLRFLTGLGLGGAMPNAVSLTAEYCPKKRRATIIIVMFAGFSFGAAVAGIVAAWIIPEYGWRAVLLVGGGLPALLWIALVAWLPESIRFLILKKADQAGIAALVRKVAPQVGRSDTSRYIVSEESGRGLPISQLFRSRAPVATLLLWTVFFINLMTNYTLQNWIPILATDGGIALRSALFIGSLYQIGSLVACLTLGLLIDRIGPFRVVPALLALAVPVIGSLGLVPAEVPILMTLAFFAGFCVPGGQTSANALAAIFYPTNVRSTGVGWALGIGRMGAIVGPVAAGWFLMAYSSMSALFLITAFIQAFAALACFAMGRMDRGIR